MMIMQAGPADAVAVTTTLHLAFLHDPINRWLCPDDGNRERLHPTYMAIFVEQALADDEVYMTPDASGVAIWSRVEPDDHRPNHTADLVAERCGAYAPRFRQFDAVMAANHPSHTPHWYLGFLAVRPGHQGRGIGTELLRDRLRDLDAQKLPAYLEAGTQRSARLYEREGFTRHGTIPLPDSEIALMQMWREPNSPSLS
jgi:ribosomal protein S18 acetylase RimI-like enzyme